MEKIDHRLYALSRPSRTDRIATVEDISGTTAGAIASLLVAIPGRMVLVVVGEPLSNLLLFFFRERFVPPAVIPAISPAVPRWEYRATAYPDAVMHHLGECFIFRAVKHTHMECLIGFASFILAATAPIRNVVFETTVTPK